MRRIFVTGSAGFIGFHLARQLLDEGFVVHGYDGLTDYYEVSLKQRRHAILAENPNFSCTIAMMQDAARLSETVKAFRPDVIIHLAAQAGVRYSLENPRTYVDTNVVGTFNVLECARQQKVEHMLIASTSSVYGGNQAMPFRETDKADLPLTTYAATKKAAEAMAHTYAHLWNIPTTLFRFFTVYGPWGRPDMAFFKFTRAMLEGKPIDIYNNGVMYRDFTYVDDIVRGIRLLVNVPPQRLGEGEVVPEGDSLSPVAPYRVVNIGNADKVKLLDFVEAIETSLGIKAVKNFMPMQPGDVVTTWADISLLQKLTGFRPATDYRDGVAKFVQWYRDYYNL